MMLVLFSQFDLLLAEVAGGIDANWLWHMVAFACLWVVELFFVQKTTLISVQDSSERRPRWASDG